MAPYRVRGMAESSNQRETPYLHQEGLVVKRTWARQGGNLSPLVVSAVNFEGSGLYFTHIIEVFDQDFGEHSDSGVFFRCRRDGLYRSVDTSATVIGDAGIPEHIARKHDRASLGVGPQGRCMICIGYESMPLI